MAPAPRASRGLLSLLDGHIVHSGVAKFGGHGDQWSGLHDDGHQRKDRHRSLTSAFKLQQLRGHCSDLQTFPASRELEDTTKAKINQIFAGLQVKFLLSDCQKKQNKLEMVGGRGAETAEWLTREGMRTRIVVDLRYVNESKPLPPFGRRSFQ